MECRGAAAAKPLFHGVSFEASDGKAVGSVIVIRGIHATGIEVQIVGIGAINGTGPIVAVRAHIVERAIVAAPVAAGAKIIALPR